MEITYSLQQEYGTSTLVDNESSFEYTYVMKSCIRSAMMKILDQLGRECNPSYTTGCCIHFMSDIKPSFCEQINFKTVKGN